MKAPRIDRNVQNISGAGPDFVIDKFKLGFRGYSWNNKQLRTTHVMISIILSPILSLFYKLNPNSKYRDETDEMSLYSYPVV